MAKLVALGPLGVILAMLIATPRQAPALGSGDLGTGLLQPVAGAVLTQSFGCTAFTLEPVAPDCPGGHFHSGIDLAAPQATPVVAAADGVARVHYDPAGYGLYLVIDHGSETATLYGHLDSVSVPDGAGVLAGSQVGRLGSSGLSTGPHLHFEVRRNGRPVDPEQFLTRR